MYKWLSMLIVLVLVLAGCKEEEAETKPKPEPVLFGDANEEQLLEIGKELRNKFESLKQETDKGVFDELRKELFLHPEKDMPLDEFDPYVEHNVTYSDESVEKRKKDFVYEYQADEIYKVLSGLKDNYEGPVTMYIVQDEDGSYKINLLQTNKVKKTKDQFLNEYKVIGQSMIIRMVRANIAEDQAEFKEAFRRFENPSEQVAKVVDSFSPGVFVSVNPTITNEEAETTEGGFIYSADVKVQGWEETGSQVTNKGRWRMKITMNNNGDYEITSFEGNPILDGMEDERSELAAEDAPIPQEEPVEETNEEPTKETEEIEEVTTKDDEEVDNSLQMKEIEVTDDENVIRAYTANWKTVETSIDNPYQFSWDMKQDDWKELMDAVRNATGLKSDDMFEWWLDNDNHRQFIATVSDLSEENVYRVYVKWEDGWKPVKVEELKKVDY